VLHESNVRAMNGDRQLWRVGDISCWMISCCSGAELQVRRKDEILIRELYPLKSDLYERASTLRTEFESARAD
jgi:hypothetical protein